jgi:serine kinase of HPr protein (carbohydrate metabolism regulator)
MEIQTMKVSDLIEVLDLQLVSGNGGLEREIKGGYVSDLLSDVMGHAREGDVWITLQTHQNVLAVASLKDLAAIVLVKNRMPEPETVAHSNEENVPVLGTRETAFEIAGKLHRLLYP